MRQVKNGYLASRRLPPRSSSLNLKLRLLLHIISNSISDILIVSCYFFLRSTQIPNTFLRFTMSFQSCLEASPACPIEATTYGYRPDLGPNIALLTVFAIVALVQLGFAFFYRLWAFSLVISAACVLEAVGYGGRIIMNNNPWSQTGFRIQIICLILAPSLLAAAVYLTLKHLVTYFGPEHSRLKPKLYTWIFIGCDILSIFLQAAGGGVAASAGKGDKENAKTADAGNSIMLAGIAFQVATMIVCGLLAGEFFYKLHRSGRSSTPDPSKPVLTARPKALLFCSTVAAAYLLILIRCVYR